MLALRVFQSCLCARSHRAFFSESDSAPLVFLPRHQHGGSPVLFTQHDQRPSTAASDMILFAASDGELYDSLSLVASDTEELAGSVTDPALWLSSYSRNARPKADVELILIMTKAVNELGLEWSPPEEPSSSRLDEWFLPGRHQEPPPMLLPLLPLSMMSSQNRGEPHTHLASVHLLQPLSHPLTALKNKDTSACPLRMSPWPHISVCPRL